MMMELSNIVSSLRKRANLPKLRHFRHPAIEHLRHQILFLFLVFVAPLVFFFLIVLFVILIKRLKFSENL